MRNLTCTVCGCVVTEIYQNPLGDRAVTCWRDADYFYDRFPERLAAAQLKHIDIPNEIPRTDWSWMREVLA